MPARMQFGVQLLPGRTSLQPAQHAVGTRRPGMLLFRPPIRRLRPAPQPAISLTRTGCATVNPTAPAAPAPARFDRPAQLAGTRPRAMPGGLRRAPGLSDRILRACGAAGGYT